MSPGRGSALELFGSSSSLWANQQSQQGGGSNLSPLLSLLLRKRGAKMIRKLLKLLRAPKAHSSSPPTKIPTSEYILLHSEAFEAWLQDECRKRAIPFYAVLALVNDESERLERELAWINQSRSQGSVLQSNSDHRVSNVPKLADFE